MFELLTYTAGGPMTDYDLPELEAIAKRSLEEGRGFRNLIMNIATSEVFTSR